MTDTDLSAMLERCEKATEGWYREGNTGTVRYGSGRPVAFVESTLQDADFIAHARTDLPLVVKELIEARELFKRVLLDCQCYGCRQDIRAFLGVSDG